MKTGVKLISSGSIAFVARILQLLISTGIGLVLPFFLDISDLGTFFLVQVLVAVGAILAQFGLTYSIAALLPEALARGDDKRARALCLKTLAICSAGSLMVLAALKGVQVFLPVEQSQMGQHLSAVGLQIALLIPLAAAITVLTEIHRAMHQITAASFLPLAQSFGILIGIIGGSLLSLPITTSALLWLGVVSMVVAAMFSLAQLVLRMRTWGRSTGTTIGTAELLTQCWPNFVTSVSLFFVSTADVWLAGAIGGPTEAAHYGLGLRIASVLLIPLATVNATITPRIVASWATGQKRNLQWLLTLTATGATLASAAGYLAMLAATPLLLTTLWGDAFVPAFSIAAILGLAQVIHTAGGSSGTILLLLGQQRLMMSVSLIIGAGTIVCASMAMSYFGIIGLALVYAAANIVQTITMLALVIRRKNLDPAAKLLNPLRLRSLMRFAHRQKGSFNRLSAR